MINAFEDLIDAKRIVREIKLLSITIDTKNSSSTTISSDFWTSSDHKLELTTTIFTSSLISWRLIFTESSIPGKN